MCFFLQVLRSSHPALLPPPPDSQTGDDSDSGSLKVALGHDAQWAKEIPLNLGMAGCKDSWGQA